MGVTTSPPKTLKHYVYESRLLYIKHFTHSYLKLKPKKLLLFLSWRPKGQIDYPVMIPFQI